jgi:ribosome-associated toxin RatA of RatAB toxin-antitoxin module
VADLGRPFQTSYLLTGSPPERIFAALLEVQRFPEWALGLRHARALDEAGRETTLRPGTTLEFTLSAAGLTHRVVSLVTVVEAPTRLEWRYTEGAEGSGGWLLAPEGPHAVRLTLSTDYEVRPRWLNRLAHRPFFRGITEDLLGRSVRRFERYLENSR